MYLKKKLILSININKQIKGIKLTGRYSDFLK